MPAQNLLGLIAFNAPRAAIPTADPAFGVQHVDGIVDDGIDQEFKSVRAADWLRRFVHLYHQKIESAMLRHTCAYQHVPMIFTRIAAVGKSSISRTGEMVRPTAILKKPVPPRLIISAV